VTASAMARVLAAAGLAFLFVAAAVASPAPVASTAATSSASLPAKQEELRRVQQKLESERVRLETTRRKERRSSDEVQRLDRQREATEQRLGALGIEQQRVRQRAEAAAAALARAETALARRRGLLADRVADVNKYGRAGYLDVILGATSFPEFVARARMVDEIVHEDARMIEAYTTDRDRTARLRDQLDEQQAQLRAVMRETEERQQTLTQEVRAKREILLAIVRERAAAERAVRELEEDSASLEALIQRLQQRSEPVRRAEEQYATQE